jgi:hypothetical protein
MSRVILFLVIWLGCCGYALWRGGPPERIGASLFLVATLASAAVQSPEGARFITIDPGVLTVDLALLASLLVLAFLADRFWPLWMSAMQAVAVLSHTAIALNPDVIPWGYWRAAALWSYPMLLLLAFATWSHQQRLKSAGADPSWKRS